VAYTADKPPLAESSEQLRARIPGWGADLDPADRPAVPRERFDPGATGAHWEFPERQPELQGWLANAFYVNQLYAWLVRVPGLGFGRSLRVTDDRVVDGAVNEVAEGVGRASRLAPVIQRGFVRTYALAFLLGAVALLLFLGLRF